MVAATLIVLLAACSNETAQSEAVSADPSPSEGPPTTSPTAAAEPTTTPTSEPTPTPTPTPEPTRTPTPFGTAVFDDPDNCEHPSGVYRVAFPDSWWWNTTYNHATLGTIDACRFFAPDQFDITTADRERPVPDGVAITLDYIDGGCLGFIDAELSMREVIVDDYTAEVRELADGPTKDRPPGGYQYLINLTPDVPCEEGGRYIVASTGISSAGDYDDNKAMLDRMMETMQIDAP